MALEMNKNSDKRKCLFESCEKRCMCLPLKTYIRRMYSSQKHFREIYSCGFWCD